MSSREQDALARIRRIVLRDNYRMQCLFAVQALNLPQAYLAAGFLRNAIWDDIHGFTTPTPLNDVDVIYYNSSDTSKQADKDIERALMAVLPSARWQVKNQARMHLKHAHAAYKDCEEAISYWVEKETCVAIRLCGNDSRDKFDVLSPYGLMSNMAGTISINPRYPRRDVFTQRVISKNWLTTWPMLTLDTSSVSPI